MPVSLDHHRCAVQSRSTGGPRCTASKWLNSRVGDPVRGLQWALSATGHSTRGYTMLHLLDPILKGGFLDNITSFFIAQFVNIHWSEGCGRPPHILKRYGVQLPPRDPMIEAFSSTGGVQNSTCSVSPDDGQASAMVRIALIEPTAIFSAYYDHMCAKPSSKAWGMRKHAQEGIFASTIVDNFPKRLRTMLLWRWCSQTS
jgi:hypothetical protein